MSSRICSPQRSVALLLLLLLLISAPSQVCGHTGPASDGLEGREGKWSRRLRHHRQDRRRNRKLVLKSEEEREEEGRKEGRKEGWGLLRPLRRRRGPRASAAVVMEVRNGYGERGRGVEDGNNGEI